MWTKEQRDELYRQVLEACKPEPPPPKPTPTTKADERWAQKPTEAVIQDATRHNHAVAERLTMEQRRQQQYAKEVAEYNAQNHYQHQLDQWWASTCAVAAAEDDYVMIGGFLERRRPSCHRGRNDSDWGLR
jgi:hypothetical protein